MPAGAVPRHARLRRARGRSRRALRRPRRRLRAGRLAPLTSPRARRPRTHEPARRDAPGRRRGVASSPGPGGRQSRSSPRFAAPSWPAAPSRRASVPTGLGRAAGCRSLSAAVPRCSDRAYFRFSGSCWSSFSAWPAERSSAAARPLTAQGAPRRVRLSIACARSATAPPARDTPRTMRPSLTRADFLASVEDSYLRTAILEGRAGTTMSAWSSFRGGPLSADDGSAVIAYLRSYADRPPREARRPAPPRRRVARGRHLRARVRRVPRRRTAWRGPSSASATRISCARRATASSARPSATGGRGRRCRRSAATLGRRRDRRRARRSCGAGRRARPRRASRRRSCLPCRSARCPSTRTAPSPRGSPRRRRRRSSTS